MDGQWGHWCWRCKDGEQSIGRDGHQGPHGVEAVAALAGRVQGASAGRLLGRLQLAQGSGWQSGRGAAPHPVGRSRRHRL